LGPQFSSSSAGTSHLSGIALSLTKQEDTSSDALFTYSFNPLFTANLVALIIFIPVLFGYISTGNPGAILFYSFLDLLMLGSAIQLYIHPVHSAWFFDSHFDVRGRKLNRKIGYDQVSRIEKILPVPILTRRTQVRIDLIGDSALVIPGNIRSKKLKIDLYSWLSKKTESRAGLH
jgi:hypothetical protein